MLKRRIKELWQLCFQDNEAFTELYFTRRYNNEVNISIQSGEEVIAAMQTLPYPMTFCGEIIPTAYVSGACTHPDYRNKGVMMELLSQAFARMHSQGILLSSLIPANNSLFQYYRKSGYASVFNYAEKTIHIEQVIEKKKRLKIKVSDEFKEETYQYFYQKMEERPCCIQHTVNDFKVILAALKLEEGKILIAKEKEKICGIALCHPTGNTVLVDEIVTEDTEIKNSLIAEASQLWQCNKITILSPGDTESMNKQLGMIRIIDAKKVLQLFAAAFPSKEMSLELTDNNISSNNGYYYITNGKCMKSNERLFRTHRKYTVETLAEEIFPPLHPYMSLMLN
ncbi:GNAT family N-acetyltransferase [uncultured Bacteroides sp.]|uniref:GNAT family N-acetyltransferase n=1 Tax=uncultured Bacteroides sp. TaxID=162156 RepID=UPI002AAAE3D9|nr:GNAT family N-acetyltransferase [uncultured Bacteroides sp.]